MGEGRQAGSEDFNHGVIGPDRSPETRVLLSSGYQTIELMVLKELKFPYQTHAVGRTGCQPQEETVYQEDKPQGSDNSSDHLTGEWNSGDHGLK